MLKVHELQKIRYSKIDEKVGVQFTERDIIPTFVPQPNIKAIDVSDLTEEQQQEVQQYLQEYAQYVKDFQQNMFKFEDWVAHTKNVDIEPKWRTFKKDNTKIL